MIAWLIFEVSINLFQSCLYLYFVKSRLNIVRNTLQGDILCISIYTLFLSSYLFFSIPVSDSIGCVVFFLYLHFVSDEKKYVCAFWILLNEIITIAIVGLITELYLSVFSIPYEALTQCSVIRIVYVITTNFILFLVVYIISKLGKKASPLSKTALVLFSALNIAILLVIEFLFLLQTNPSVEPMLVFYISYSALIVSSVFSVLLFHLMTTISERDHQTQIALSHAQMTKDHQQTIKDMYTDMISRQHDFKHHLQILEQLLLNNDINIAQSFFCQYRSEVSNAKQFLTGNIAVDALLTAKYLSCTSLGITFELIHCPLSDLPISEVDFCTIIGNLLDNAIEGISRIDNTIVEKRIILSLSRAWDMFTIHCENPLNFSTVKQRNNSFISSKDCTNQIHGYGIPNIIKIAKGADGFCSFDICNNIFSVTVTIPYPITSGKKL